MGLSSFTDGGYILKIKLLSINKTTFTVTRLLLYLNLGVIESISMPHNSPRNALADCKHAALECKLVDFLGHGEALTSEVTLERLLVSRSDLGRLDPGDFRKSLWGSRRTWQTSGLPSCCVPCTDTFSSPMLVVPLVHYQHACVGPKLQMYPPSPSIVLGKGEP